MVQEKDAAKKRVEARRKILSDSRERLKKNTIKFRWYVSERTPGYTEWGYYGGEVPAKEIKVSKYFDNEKDAQDWMNNHEPDKGKTLHVRRERLIKREFTEWVTY